MDLYKAIRELYEQKKRLDQVIASLEELEQRGPVVNPEPTKRRGRRSMDAQARLEVSQRMKRYWAKRRREGRKPQGPPNPSESPTDGATPRPTSE